MVLKCLSHTLRFIDQPKTKVETLRKKQTNVSQMWCAGVRWPQINIGIHGKIWASKTTPHSFFFFSILQAFTLLVIKILNIFYLHYLEAFDTCFGGIHCGDSFKFLISSKVSKRFPHLSPAILSFLSEINFAHPSLLNFYRANGFKVITVDWTEAKNNERVFAANFFCQKFCCPSRAILAFLPLPSQVNDYWTWDQKNYQQLQN